MLIKNREVKERKFNPRYPRLFALTFGVLLTIIIIFFAEVVFGLLNKSRGENCIEIQKSSKPFTMQDKEIGYKLIPDVKVAFARSINNDLLYAVSYSIDEYGRRITPQENTGNQNKYALFFGCSCTFGVGINDNETLPYYFSKFASKYKTYNYGVGGYGTQQILVKLQDKNLRKEIKEKEGILILQFADFHILRAIGASLLYNTYGSHLPHFKLKDGLLVRDGDFTSGRPVLSHFYRLLDKSQIAKYFKIQFPLWITEDHIKLTAKIIEECRNAYKDNFGNENFYVLIISDSNKNNSRLIPYLEQAGIKYIDYSNLLTEHIRRNNLKLDDLRIKHDGHPTAKSNGLIAKKLIQDLVS